MNPTLGLLLPLALANPPTVPIPPPGVGCVPVVTPYGIRLACPPVAPPSPVLYVRLLAPAGTTVAFRPGVASPVRVAAPATAGFRPGYRYTLELTDLPGHPGRRLYPVIEVYGSLVPRATFVPADFPTPVAVSPAAIDRALGGTLITKVIYLEDPTKAVPVESRPDLPLEFTELTVDDALRAARDNGRLVAVVRIGDRVPEAEDLARADVPDTVQLPGDPALGPAAVAPLLPCGPVQLFDPILGPKPTPEECLTDGGDKGPRLGIGPDGRLGGLNPTDLGVAYTSRGRRRVATSNEVCVCSPRFVARRVEHAANGINTAVAAVAATQATIRVVASNNLAAQAAVNRVKPVEVGGRVRPAIFVIANNVAEVVGLNRPQVEAKIQSVRVIIGSVETDEITSGPDQLVVTKAVRPAGPVQAGEVVTFTVTYRNATAFPASDLVLSDSLSGRLEYVEGSQQSDRPANVTTAPNEAGSVVLRFEIPGPIPPGGGGIVKFQARVR